MATVQKIVLEISTYDSANVVNSALNFTANNGDRNLQNLINYLNAIAGGAAGVPVRVDYTLPGSVTGSWVYPNNLVVTPTASPSPTVTPTLTPTPTVTPSAP